jgi:hypothetical protein
MVKVIGGNGRISWRKDMEHLTLLMDADTSDNTCMIYIMGMEYSHGQMEKFIMENGNRDNGKDMD